MKKYPPRISNRELSKLVAKIGKQITVVQKKPQVHTPLCYGKGTQGPFSIDLPAGKRRVSIKGQFRKEVNTWGEVRNNSQSDTNWWYMVQSMRAKLRYLYLVIERSSVKLDEIGK